MQTAAQTSLQAAVHSAFRMGSRPAATVPSAESSAAFSNIAPLPLNEVARLQLLRDLHILDTPREPAFDAITRRAAQLCDAPLAVISLVDRDRVWVKSFAGRSIEPEMARGLAFCSQAILDGEMLVVEDASRDERFARHPLVRARNGVRFYAGMPLAAAGGFALGALCVLDDRVRRLEPAQAAALRDLAVVATALLEARKSEAQAAQLGHALDRAFDEIYMLDPTTLLVQHANEGARQALGYSSAEVRQLHLWNIDARYPVEQIKALGRAALRDGAVASQLCFEAQHTRKDGSIYPVEARVMFATADGPRQLLLLVNDISARKTHELGLRHLAESDSVTHLPNRHHFENQLAAAMQRTRHSGASMAVLLLQIDRFKEIRHGFGHRVADQVLVEFARRMMQGVGNSNLIAHLGGDEFGVIFENYDDPDTPREVASNVRSSLGNPFQCVRSLIHVSASMGIAYYEGGPEDADAMLCRADEAANLASLSGTSLHVIQAGADFPRSAVR